MDFMSDRLFDKRPFRILVRRGARTNGALTPHRELLHARGALDGTERGLSAYQVVDERDRLCRLRGKPRSIRVDNGPELASRLLDQWAPLSKVALDFSRPATPSDNDASRPPLRDDIEPGSPWENGYNETFDGKLRDELFL